MRIRIFSFVYLHKNKLPTKTEDFPPRKEYFLSFFFFPFLFFSFSIFHFFFPISLSSGKIKREKKKQNPKRISKKEKLIYICFATVVPVIRKVPLDELPQPSLQIRRRFIPKLPPRITNVRMRKRNVAVSWHIHNLLLRFRLQMLLQYTHKCRHGHR